ncbi:ultraviolet-B receptor UVR8 isoform X2 [Amborella trichopoda]|uniref:ultraviolet-B receptor UVR8 isoform X2 n=1 Tax=Amborella trichopoda TaxID=13333 RepID=UPI0009BE2771|nr:ultraviolet-B receptor UVR8 isoform X2 [Amborella trichopoda]|eukprot:XP_020525563.1 ultraviolet-B receptor UVR8 isoform X2 [Amborella trichopoda]
MLEKKEGSPMVFMWGYLPGSSPERGPLFVPTRVERPSNGEQWKDVCGGGCGFAVAISESGKLHTWGSTDDLGQSYVASGKHERTPEPFPLPTDSAIVKAAAGWAHCVAATESGEVYTWGWKECVPTGKTMPDPVTGQISDKALPASSSGSLPSHVDEKLQTRPTSSDHHDLVDASPSTSSDVSWCTSLTGTRSKSVLSGFSQSDSLEGAKRRRLAMGKQSAEKSNASDEDISANPCLVTLSVGVKVSAVAAGGRHTLALSDMGQVWGWGYGGEGQLGLGSRIPAVSSPHPIACIEASSYWKQIPQPSFRGSNLLDDKVFKPFGSYIKAIACGGRHSAVITDAGALLTFGWGLYGQCGHGSTDDELSPTCLSSLGGIQIQGVGAGLWHTVCISVDGAVYAFGGNQFGQLGTGDDQAVTLPKLLEAPSIEHKHAKIVSCGARHSAIITGLDDGDDIWAYSCEIGGLYFLETHDRALTAAATSSISNKKECICGTSDLVMHHLLLCIF